MQKFNVTLLSLFIIGQATQNLVFGLASREINIKVTNLIPPIEKSSPQI